MNAAIRPARADEAAALTDLVRRSKAHWGYDPAFMAVNQAVLTVTARGIAKDVVYVYEGDGRPLGVYELRVAGARGEVELFFVAPEAIGAGIGRALWRHMVDEARARGVKRLRIESDPYARGFYEAMGARIVGAVASDTVPGRRLPLLEFAIPD